jgi:thioredoxin 1
MRQLFSVSEFKELAESESRLIVIDCFAEWCPPCRMIKPIFEQFAVDYPDVCFVKVDVDAAEDVAVELSISSMPTFIFYKGGKEVHRFSGASKSLLQTEIEKRK